MDVNIFLLPLLGGYIFIKRSTWYRFYSIRYNAQEILLSSAVTGLIGVTIAFIITTSVKTAHPGIYDWWKSHIYFDFLGTALVAFIVLVGAGTLPNRWIDEEEKIKEIIREDNDGIELILLKALEEAKLVSITIKSGKVYVGFISHNFFSPSSELRSIKIIPVQSGFRNSDDHHIEFTTYYEEVIEFTEKNKEIEMDIEDFQMGIPIHEIVSINIFDPRVYEKFTPKTTSDQEPDES